MNLCSVLIVDRKPLRSAALRAHLWRYQLPLALACEHPSNASPSAQAVPWAPKIMRGTCDQKYTLWLVVLGHDTELADWRAVTKPAATHWVALRVPGSKLSESELLGAHFDQVFTLPLSPKQLDQLLQQQATLQPSSNLRLHTGEQPRTAPTTAKMPLLDDTSAQAAAMGDVGLVNELRAMLRDDLHQRIPQVAQELSRYDIAEAAETVHRLVGGCGYCGAKALQQASLDLENALHARDVDAVDQAYGPWLQAAEELLVALSE